MPVHKKIGKILKQAGKVVEKAARITAVPGEKVAKVLGKEDKKSTARKPSGKKVPVPTATPSKVNDRPSATPAGVGRRGPESLKKRMETIERLKKKGKPVGLGAPARRRE